MNEIYEFLVYALKCAGNIFAGALGRGGSISGNWVKDGFVGIATILLLLLILYWFFRITGLYKIKK